MRKLGVFNHVSLDGYFTDANGDFRWASQGSDDAEYAAFVAENAGGGGLLVLGRITYELMAAFWPSADAMRYAPAVAEGMNRMTKVVFSKTLQQASWQNARVVNGDPAAEIRKIKAEPGEDMVILGSGSIVSQLAQQGLIDEYQVVMNPVILGKGRTMFDGMKAKIPLKLNKKRVFGNGKIFLSYQPAT